MDWISILEKTYKEPFTRDYKMASLTTWKIGGISAVVALPETINGLVTLINFATKNIIPYYILGRGSNVLVGDNYFNGIIIYLGKNFSSIFTKGNEIEAYAGVTLNQIGVLAKKSAFKNAEFLRGIPGSLGGALITNAEAYKIAISDFVESVRVFENGVFKDYNQSMCDFSYRHSIFEKKDNFCIVKATLVFEKGDIETINQNYKNTIEFRKTKQPKYPNGGSIFKNPKNGPAAGYLIDQLKLKGLDKGDAVISEVHGNFILNKNKAKAADVLYLIEKIKNQVMKAYNIELQLEIKKINC
ncbi:hypothetical protein AZF37_02405 [endosymbiont 'TC1' of Trimyema compressum]|uniref:UDP-N-acetylmuramate dehydrogenase n=1 Tax=endosymbiont 'TC1' of Trimyema compressum TaxID=243899 RepID=UPI0007F05D45|nr:UDP-N-acetylmuramate dehydrogenase [endosymbiont 'TC1' of Trimyema compressum]AMP20175.1 hypothetical protein AZF37_02405 [endosymbiont 'TC1' of Trimyema compressum]